MRKSDFARIIGVTTDTDYAPVAGMLQNGYGFVGHFDNRLNEGLEETLVVINARLADLREKAGVPGVPRQTLANRLSNSSPPARRAHRPSPGLPATRRPSWPSDGRSRRGRDSGPPARH
jgi:hypothetical protein